MKLTLISHFYNEEFLLPYWIDHYINMVDEAIMVDYASNDSSIDVIRSLAPHWKIIKSRNQYFDTEEIDKEIMDIESSINGWKMTLNTTEFLLKRNLKEYLWEFEKIAPGFGAISTNGVWMVDDEYNKNQVLDNRPLVLQKNRGFFEKDKLPFFIHPKTAFYLNEPSRSRLIHNKKHGCYHPGRHKYDIPHYSDENLLLLWFGYSPYSYIKQRKLNIYKKKSKEFIDQIKKTKGEDYFNSMVSTTEQDLDEKFVHFSSMSEDLTNNFIYNKEIKLFNI